MCKSNVMNVCALLLLVFATTSNAAVPVTGVDRYRFDVYLDDARIGTHRVEISKDDGGLMVTTNASYRYTILFIPVYTYEHRAVENWRDGCLYRVESDTNDNGEVYSIAGEMDSGSLVISTRDGERALGKCARSYAYWNPEYLMSERLLNTQNGEYQSADIEDLGITLFSAGNAVIRAQCYRLQTEEGDIMLWYDTSGRWQALESRVVNGSMIRYVSSDIAQLQGGSS